MQDIKVINPRDQDIRRFDIKYSIIWFMVSMYPLIVIPNNFYRFSPLGIIPPDYFYGPRYIVLTIISMISLFALRKQKILLNKVSISLTLFIVFGMFSTVLAIDPIVAWFGSSYRYTGASTYVFCIIIFIIAAKTNKVNDILQLMVYTASIVSILSVLQYFNINLVPHEPSRNRMISYGTLANPNFLGTYTAFILPASMYFFIKTKKRFWLLSSSLIYAGLLVAHCRGAWLAFSLSLLIIGIYFWKTISYRRNLFTIFFIFIIITAFLIPARDGFILKRIISVPGELGSGLMLNKEAGANRMFIWLETVKLLKDYWAFGIGPDNLFYAGILTPSKNVVDKAHNIFLEIGVTMGVFSLASYLFFLSNFLRGWKNEIGFIYFVMILTYITQGLFNIDVVMNMPLFWIVLGLSLAESRNKSNVTN